ncbi:MAG TPA: sigma-70 family RNA polymerase sigma factor [Acidimicrobiales bacterium]|nr:sigma-70 family RNA polymerase sigma factor [Acidimicrobiales bacterium]
MTVAVNQEPTWIGVEMGDHREPDCAAVAAQESFEAFFDRLLPRAVGVGRRILGSPSDGEDAAVEGLARAYLRWAELSQAPHRDAWVLRVTANAAYDLLRREARARRHATSELAQLDDRHAVELRETLLPSLRRLSRRQREVVILSYMVGLTQEEIAELLGCSVGSVKVHARRGLDRLRGELADLADVMREDR